MRFQSMALLGLCLGSALAVAYAKPVQMSSSAIFFYDCGGLMQSHPSCRRDTTPSGAPV